MNEQNYPFHSSSFLIIRSLVHSSLTVIFVEFNWNDYKDVDVEGKTLITLVNEPSPPDNPDLFNGETLTYYGD
jgi:hypothetical protein